ncbi:MAG: 16S rRNA (uracil(1498)-N(3))-methyltransferase [Gammaproteobacteria bacterium]|nr:MAG: 16S rRNA (uracil(1498)-N(3))-methyltransferase [Gammaproteobacteria bacterium]
MRRHRVFSSKPLRDQARTTLSGDRGRYLTRVLRLARGAELVLFDGSGLEWPAVIEGLGRDRVELITGEATRPHRESPLALRLLQGVSRGERMDYAVQKATELGVHSIVPVLTRYGVVRLAGAQAEKRRRHWQEVAISACEQSGRCHIPAIAQPAALASVLAGLPADGPRWRLDPAGERALGQDAAPAADAIVTVLIGPEGGFDDSEARVTATAGFEVRTLGPRVLRTETAAAAVAAVLQARWGDLSPARG